MFGLLQQFWRKERERENFFNKTRIRKNALHVLYKVRMYAYVRGEEAEIEPRNFFSKTFSEID